MANLGFRLVRIEDGAVIKEWPRTPTGGADLPSVIKLENGDQVCGASAGDEFSGFRLEEITGDLPPKTVFDGAYFLGRVTDDEYAAIVGSENIQVRRWLDTFRLRGEIDVTGATAQAAKAGLIALGLLSQERADIIFAVE
jgi:hypothetical protein